MQRPLARLAVGVVATALVAALAAPSLATPRRVSVPAVPAYATRANLIRHASGTVEFRVVLRWRDQAALLRAITAVTTPGTASYGHYLSPAQFRARFAPARSDVDRVASWLRGKGLSIGAIPSNRLWVSARGSVAQVERALGTTLNVYRFLGRPARAAASDVSIPASLADVVLGVTGLDQTRAVPASHPPLNPLFRNAPPCSNYWGEKLATDKPKAYGQFQPYAQCGLRPTQIRGAYGVNAVSENGLGITIGIIDAYASPTIVHDVKTYSDKHGLPQPALLQLLDPQGSQDTGWYAEESLDLEATHAMAPRAKQVYFGASSAFTSALDNVMNEAINWGKAHLISNSYGVPGELNVPASTRNAEDAMYQQAAAQGIGIYFSSGDSGDETHNLGLRETDWPAASAWVTSVGGTSLGVTQNHGYAFETFWGTYSSTQSGSTWSPTPPGTFKYAGGGGTSRVEAQPSYQVGVVPSSLSGYFGGSPKRVIPDLSMDGDPSTGFLLGYTQQFPDGTAKYSEYRIGGTSLSSPLVAGLIALADQRAGQPHGFLNDALYSIVGSTTAFHDIVAPSQIVAMVRNDYANGVNQSGGITTTLRTTSQLDTLHILTGYDDATGIGTPIAPAFLSELPG